MKTIKALAGILIITAALAGQTQGQGSNQIAISGLFNTGLDASGVALPGGSADLHWSLSGTAAGNPKVISPQNMYSQWAPDTASSEWIGIVDNGLEPTAGPYYFNLSFSLAGFDPTTAILSGTWWGDDSTSIQLNGHVIASSPLNVAGITWSVNDIGPDSGWFNPATNTLTVEMNADDGIYDGVRVEVTGTAAPTQPPTITNQPQPVTVGLGGSASFNVNAYGATPLGYQWQFNGTNLPSATNATLSLLSVSLDQAGPYQVVITNLYGAVTSPPATLDVLFISFSVNGQLDASNVTAVASAEVTISGGYPDGFLFYTTDGSSPTLSSPLYTGPFTLTNSAELQAMSLSEDFSQSAFAVPVTVQIIPGFNLQTSVIGTGTITLNPASGPYASNSVVTLTANAAPNWAFAYWTGGATGSENPINVTMTGPVSVQANFIPTAYPLTVGTAGGGNITVNGQMIVFNTFYPAGSVVTLNAAPSNGWSFLGWQGDVSSTNNPLTVTIDQTNNIQAIFGTDVATNTVGGGGIVLNLPNPVPYGTVLTASAAPNAGNYLVVWSGAASGTKTPTTLLVTNPNPTVHALFTTLPGGKSSLAVVVLGSGVVAINPQQSFYNAGDNVTLTASTTNAGIDFFGWTGNASGTNNPLLVIVNSNTIIQANFGPRTAVSILPQNLIVYAGSNAVLTAHASGIPPLSYQWQNSQGAIAGETNATFAIVDAQATNTDSYSVVVSNPFGSVTSAVVTVTVVFPPSISVQPIPQVVVAGSNFTLSISASGTVPLDFQWINDEGAIDGATNSDLTINPTETNDTGNYYVVVSNSYGVVTSQLASVVVYAPVAFQSQPNSLVVPAFASATFEAIASGFPSSISYQWTFDGSNLAGATLNTLTVQNVQLTDLGNYQVFISNAYSSNLSDVATLNMSPSLISPFTGANTIWGTSANFSVGAIGSGDLNYQWFLNGVAIDGATNSTLDFPSIQFTNAGAYSVVVSSPFGMITNGTAPVVVAPSSLSLGFCPALTIGGVVGYSYIIQSSTNLADTNAWVTLTNLTLTQPVQLWVDTNVDASLPSNPQYFYRVLPGP